MTGSAAADWLPTGSVTVRVPGKVNLYLEVGDRRPDGFHELTTVFHAVSLADDVTVRDADVLSLRLLGEGAEGGRRGGGGGGGGGVAERSDAVDEGLVVRTPQELSAALPRAVRVSTPEEFGLDELKEAVMEAMEDL